ncbi:TonB-dependent receptor [Seleniivibrio sp.]|uniref:TonB-dependent receptor n=1 Tax=Seleniivibrio sp. TaxID=2898801 RepID=UPI0025E85666|nr:TonB-dependent receptor [Seleniivibrio sp.]MCD8554732.1 TonB-dependent receptor [Seleniivibrio sp.]
MKRILLVTVIALAAMSAPVFAEDSATLEETAVTATRTTTAVEDAPASVSVITGDEIKQHSISTIDDALKYETGVMVGRNKGIMSATPSIALRGLNGQDRTLIMIDGIPVNDGYSAGVTWTQLGVQNVERIEITRGPASALYGGHALGGAVNIITHKPAGREGQVTLGTGSDGTRKLSLSYGDTFSDKFGIRIGYEQEKTDGYATGLVRRSVTSTVPTGTQLYGGEATTSTAGADQVIVGDTGRNWAERQNVNLQTYYTPDAVSMLNLNIQWGRHQYGYDSPNSYLTDASGNTAYSGYVVTEDGRYATVTPNSFVYYNGNGDETYTTYSAIYERDFGKVNLTAKLSYSDKDKWYTSAGSSGTYDTAAGTLSDSNVNTWFTDIQATGKAGSKHTVTGGFTYRADDYDASGYSLSFYRDEDSKTAKTDITQGKTDNYGLYVQDEWLLPANFTIYAGVRYDSWKATDGKSGSIGSVEEFEEPSDSAVSPKIALVWKPLKETSLRTSYGTAFRPPSIYDLYRTWKSGTTTYHSNPDLDPEKLKSWELGFDQFFFAKKMKLTGTYYRSELKDALERTATGSDRYMQNVGKARIDGIELGIEYLPVKNLKLYANAAWVDSEVLENDNNPDSEGKKLTDVPEKVFNVGSSYKWRMLTFALDGNYQGRIYTADDNTDVDDVYGGYTERWLWNTKVIAEIGKHFEVSGAINNIFDKEYYDYYVGRERNYMVEVTAKF